MSKGIKAGKTGALVIIPTVVIHQEYYQIWISVAWLLWNIGVRVRK